MTSQPEKTVADFAAARARILADGGVEKKVASYVRAILCEELEVARVECFLDPSTGRFDTRVDVFACMGVRASDAHNYMFALADAFSVAESWRALTCEIELTADERESFREVLGWLSAFGID